MEVIITSLKYLKLVFLQHYHVYSTCGLKCFVVVIKVIMQFDCKNETTKKQAMYIQQIQMKVIIFYIITIHDNNSQNKAFRGEFGQFLNSPQIIINGNIRYLLTIKNGLYKILSILTFIINLIT